MLGGKTICLSMIVKNEAHVIARALASVRGLIDAYVIIDTGSTDDTKRVITETLLALPGTLLDRPWVDFATNRNQSLELALPCADYVLILDADEVYEPDPWFTCDRLDGDACLVEMRLGEYQYTARRLLHAALPWRWVGVLHEYPDCPEATRNVQLRGFNIRARVEGARSKDPDKFVKDAALLLAALEREPENDRYAFYLGQTYRDGKEYAKAIDAYQRRLDMDHGWTEEAWYARLALAWCKDQLGHPWPEVEAAYLAAYADKPERAEPLYYIACHWINEGALASADLFLRAAYACPIPLHAPLFVDRTLHSTIIPLEYSYVCFKLGRFSEALTITNRLLCMSNLEPKVRSALLENQAMALATMGLAVTERPPTPVRPTADVSRETARVTP